MEARVVYIRGIKLIYDGGKTPLIVCPDCKGERRCPPSTLRKLRHGQVTGRCRACSNIGLSERASQRTRLTERKYRSNGSVIYWDQRDMERKKVPVKCGQCGNIREYHEGHATRNFFTGICRSCSQITGKKASNWNGGKTIKQHGYVSVHKDLFSESERQILEPMLSMNRVLEHRAVMALYLGRPLERHEIVHHLNSAKDDNRIENLILVRGHSEHRKADVSKLQQLYNEIARLRGLLNANGISYQLTLF